METNFILTEGTQGMLMREPDFLPFLTESLAKYNTGDFGDLPEEDVPGSTEALTNGRGFALGVYPFQGQPIWIAQSLPGEPNPVILLPAEY